MSTRRSTRLGGTATATAQAVSAVSESTTRASRQSRKRKASIKEDEQTAETRNGNAAPVTPAKRRPVKAARPPPATPTPSAVGLMNAAATRTPAANPKPRSAAPDVTNASLVSPGTSRVITSHPKPATAPTGTNDRTPLTTSTLLEVANNHLIAVDPRMKPLIDAHSASCHVFSPTGLAENIDPFESLTSGIISQQVSGAAAKAIKNKFIALFDHEQAVEATTTTPTKRFPTPAQVSAESIERLRTAGLSQRKAEYVKGLAEKFEAGDLSAQLLADAPYDEILEKLTAVRGLGKWSVEMFACFALKRMDVLSLGDLGVQRGMAAFVGRDVAKLKAKGAGNKWKYMNEKEMTELSDKFKPYRSLFQWYMWRVEETDISTLE